MTLKQSCITQLKIQNRPHIEYEKWQQLEECFDEKEEGSLRKLVKKKGSKRGHPACKGVKVESVRVKKLRGRKKTNKYCNTADTNKSRERQTAKSGV